MDDLGDQIVAAAADGELLVDAGDGFDSGNPAKALGGG